MTEDTGQDDIPDLSAFALAEWAHHVDNVLRGIAHALNNRAAALSAVIELSTEPVEDPVVIRGILGTELERVSDLVKVVRTIGAPRSGMEAFAAKDAAAEARAVLELHAEQRDRLVVIDAQDATPIRAHRWMFVRALIAAAAGLRDAVGDPAPAAVTVATEGDWVVVSANGSAPAGRASPLAAELARAMGGAPLDDRYGFRVLTLAALRRREGR
jgi:hypothetical protein